MMKRPIPEVLEFNFNRLRAAVYRALLKRRFPDDTDIVREYADEAEHQDGYGYWGMFNSPSEAYEDFLRYKENR